MWSRISGGRHGSDIVVSIQEATGPVWRLYSDPRVHHTQGLDCVLLLFDPKAPLSTLPRL